VCLCVCRCMCKIDMYCNCYRISVTETMVTADKNIDLMLRKFKLTILNHSEHLIKNLLKCWVSVQHNRNISFIIFFVYLCQV
jgi:hypothetical protein